MIHVLVVDDSAFMRKLISDFINEQSDMKAAGTARNGEDALNKLAAGHYDVVTLDIEMPVMGGLTALRKIMIKERPLPVVMVSSLTVQGATQTLEAMDIGAVDVVAKPSGSISLNLHEVKEELIYKIRAAAGVNMEAHLNRGRRKAEMVVRIPTKPAAVTGSAVIGIGTSTGGPKALQYILPRLQADLRAPIFIVQHMPPGFTRSLADRLNRESSITVKEAAHDETAEKGTVYIAPGGKQLSVEKREHSLVMKVTEAPPVNGHRPSVDVLFSSLARLHDYDMTGIILTGMGRDGARGLKEMKQQGNCVAVAESEKTAIVYGMPKAAFEETDIDYSLELGELPSFLNSQHSLSLHH